MRQHARGERSRGAGAGFTFIELFLVISLIAVIAAIAIPNLIEARKGSNETAAIGSMRTLVTAQSIFREGDKDKNGILDYATSISALANVNLIDSTLGTGMKQGYVFAIVPTCVPSTLVWCAVADPANPGKTGDRYFFVDESGVIRFTIGAQANSMSTPIGG